MPINKLKTTSIETDAITADLLAAGSVTVADIPDAEITDAKLHTNLDFSTKTFTMHTNHVTHAMVTQHQAQLAIGADQIDSGSPTFGGDVTITGNLTVNGTTTTLNTETLTVDDNIIVLNNNEAGTPSQNAGIEIERGTSANVDIRWNETTDKWQFTNDGTTYVDIGSGGDVVDDTTPQLGGNLDVNGKSITASSGTIDFEINNHKSFFIGDSYIKIDADNNYSAGLSFIRDKSTPANGDVLAYIFAQGRDSGNALQSFARIDLNSEIVTAGLERGAIVLRNIVGGSYQDFFKADANLMQNILYKDIKADTGVDLIFEGATANTYETTLTVVDPTADRTITLPDATGTVPVFATAPTGAITDGSSGQALTTDGNGGLSFTTVSGGGATSAYAKFTYEIAATVNSVSGNDTNGNTLSYSAGNNVVEVFVNGVKQQEGSGKDYQATTGNSVVFTNNLYNGDLVDVVAYNMFSAGNINIDGNGNLEIGNNIIFEGATANAFETTLTVTDPTADRTITLPNKTGNIAVQTSDNFLQIEDTASNPNQLGININAVNSTSRSNLKIGPYSFDHWIIDVDPDQAEQFSSLYFRIDNEMHMHLGNGNLGTPMNTMYKPIFFSNSAYGVGNTIFYAEGDTNDSNELEVRITDPTADRIITFPDLSGTILVNENLGGDPANDNGNLIISHGATGQPMASITSGAQNNIAIGNQNLTSNVNGDGNIAIGKLCLAGNDANNNLAIGNNVLRYGASHNQNTLLGMYNSPQSGATGFYRNTFVGYGGGYSNASGDYNTSIGSYARAYYNNTSYSTALGYAAIPGFNHCTNVGTYTGASMNGQSDYCTFVGSYAGYDMDGGDRCTFVGYRAGYQGGSGSYNTAVGVNSMYDLSSGERNTFVGDASGYHIESGSNNSILGQAAGNSLTTGSQNTLIGAQAGQTGTNNLVSGSNNIMIGYQAQGTSDSMSNTIVLGNASISSLQCNVQSISALSDERDKTDIQDLTLGLDFIKAMRPVQFTWNRRDGTLGTRKEVGFVAQELQEVEMDFNSKNRTHMVNDDDPSKLLAAPMQSYPILIKAIQELSAKVDSLQAEVNTLKNGG